MTPRRQPATQEWGCTVSTFICHVNTALCKSVPKIVASALDTICSVLYNPRSDWTVNLGILGSAEANKGG
eukprot:4530590-Amphidinium_carterae.1